MKTHATFRYFFTFASLAAVLAMHPRNSRAQAASDEARKEVDAAKGIIEGYNKEHSRAQVKTAAEEAQAKEDMAQYDIVISNGVLLQEHNRATVKTVVEWLRKHYDGANIVYAPGLAEEVIPDVKLRAHDLAEVLEALRVASGNKFHWECARDRTGAIDPNTGLPLPKVDPSSGLYVLTEAARTGQNERVVEAFNVANYLALKISEFRSRQTADENKKHSADERERIENLFVDELESVLVETVAGYLQTQDQEQIRHSLKFQFHQGAELLIVTGPREQVDVVRKVMGALTTDPAGVNVTMPGGPAMIANARENAAGTEEPVSIEAIPVKSADMTTAYSAAMSLLNNKRSKVVVMDEHTKTLIVSATKAEVSAIKDAIKQLDRAAHPFKEDLLPDVPEKAR